jgi:hypothetical protein
MWDQVGPCLTPKPTGAPIRGGRVAQGRPRRRPNVAAVRHAKRNRRENRRGGRANRMGRAVVDVDDPMFWHDRARQHSGNSRARSRSQDQAYADRYSRAIRRRRKARCRAGSAPTAQKRPANFSPLNWNGATPAHHRLCLIKATRHDFRTCELRGLKKKTQNKLRTVLIVIVGGNKASPLVGAVQASFRNITWLIYQHRCGRPSWPRREGSSGIGIALGWTYKKSARRPHAPTRLDGGGGIPERCDLRKPLPVGEAQLPRRASRAR